MVGVKTQMSAKCYSGQKISLKIGVKCYNARTFQKIQLYGGQNSRKWPSAAFYFVGSIIENSNPCPACETTFDIAALPRYDLAGQIQANAHALLFVLIHSSSIKASEDGSLIVLSEMPFMPVSVTLISTYISHYQ